MTNLTNNHMDLTLIANIEGNALLKRNNDNSYVVVNGLDVKENNTCTWAFAYAYVQEFTNAVEVFEEKVFIPFKQSAVCREIREGYVKCMRNHTCGNYINMSDVEGLKCSDIEWSYMKEQLIAYTEFGTYHYDYDVDFSFDDNLFSFVDELREHLMKQVAVGV